MDIYNIPPGHVRMTQWNVIKIESLDTLHIAGYDLTGHRWRISSEVLEVDLKKLKAKTISGSCYSFVEPRGEMHKLVLEVLNTHVQGKYTVVDDKTLEELSPKEGTESEHGGKDE
jgi:hypothetical protein